jgi:hypothetical protein
MHALRRREAATDIIIEQEDGDIRKLKELFAEYRAHMKSYLDYLGSRERPQLEDVLEGIRRSGEIEPVLDAFEISSRHYQQFGFSRLADLVLNCRMETASILKNLKTIVFADPELPPPPIRIKPGGAKKFAFKPPDIDGVMLRLAQLRALVSNGSPFWVAYSTVEAKYGSAK